MEEATELSDYLPLSFKTPTEREYVDFLWDAFKTNYTYGKCQFAFLAYHMLTMSFVYFNIWQIKKTEPKNFEMSLIGFGKDVEKHLTEATSPSDHDEAHIAGPEYRDDGQNVRGRTGRSGASRPERAAGHDNPRLGNGLPASAPLRRSSSLWSTAPRARIG